jgi:hypothetical protein
VPKKKSRKNPPARKHRSFSINSCLQATEHINHASCGLTLAHFITTETQKLGERDKLYIDSALRTAKRQLEQVEMSFPKLGAAAKRAKLATSKALNLFKKASPEPTSEEGERFAIAVQKASGLNTTLLIQAKGLCIEGGL